VTQNQYDALCDLDQTHSRVSFATDHAELLAGGPLDAPEYIETGYIVAFVDSFDRTGVETKRVHRTRWPLA
jgi:hypothetical protein